VFKPGWWASARAVVKLVRVHTRIADALERLADAAEGHPREWTRGDVTDVEEVGPHTRPSDTREYANAYAVEQELAKILGRTPTAEEITHELDGEMHAGGDPNTDLDAILARVKAMTTSQAPPVTPPKAKGPSKDRYVSSPDPSPAPWTLP